jgi:hypothetical protein
MDRYACIYRLLSDKLQEWDQNHPNEYPFVRIRLVPIRKDVMIKKENNIANWFKDRQLDVDATLNVDKTRRRVKKNQDDKVIRRTRDTINVSEDDKKHNIVMSPDNCSYSYTTDVRMTVTLKDLPMAISIEEGEIPQNDVELIEIEDQEYNIKVRRKVLKASKNIVAMRALQFNNTDQLYSQRTVNSIEEMIDQLKHTHVLINKKIDELELQGLSRISISGLKLGNIVNDIKMNENDKVTQTMPEEFSTDFINVNELKEKKKIEKTHDVKTDLVTVQTLDKLTFGSPEDVINITAKELTDLIDRSSFPKSDHESKKFKKDDKQFDIQLKDRKSIEESFFLKDRQTIFCKDNCFIFLKKIIFTYTHREGNIFKGIEICQPFSKADNMYFISVFKFRIYDVDAEYSDDSFLGDDDEGDND